MSGTLNENATLLMALRANLGLPHAGCEIGVCVPFPYLAQTQALLAGSPVSWGAQDISAHDKGAYTGEVSGAMLAEFGVRWVLVGHSERRVRHRESDETVAAKARAALAAGLTPIVCVGETQAEYEAHRSLNVILGQLAPILTWDPARLARIVVAYEPVWAIGTGCAATPAQIQAVHYAIRSALQGAGAPQARIVYGGSVKAANAAALFQMPDIDGVLVGSASRMLNEFLAIAASRSIPSE
jgi:triosephosphate isomerase